MAIRAKDPKQLQAEIGERIRTAVKNAGLTQEQLAKRTGIKQPVISKIMTGKMAKTDADYVLKIARVCNVANPSSAVSFEYLLTGVPGAPGTAAAPEGRPAAPADEDLPDGLAHYLSDREDRIAPAVVKKMKHSHFQDTEGVVFDDDFWDEQRIIWEKRLGLSPLGASRGSGGAGPAPGSGGGAGGGVSEKKG